MNRELEVTKTAKDVFRQTIKLQFNDTITYCMRNQMIRAALSIGSNIEEGYARGGDKEFARFLAIALGSARELAYQLTLYEEIKGKQPELTDLIDKCCAQIFKLMLSQRSAEC
jgi:four helix bundle protein